MKRFSGLVIAACLTLLTSTAFGADTVKIGVAGAHTGDLASYGLPTVNAAKLVAKDINAKGGIDGKQIELLIQDEECKPEKATNAATKLVSDGAVVVLGHICSGATKAAMPIYTEAKIVTMSPSATTVSLTQSGEYPTFFRTISPDDAQAKLGAEYAIDKLGAKKIAVLHDKGDYGKGYAEFAQAFILEGGKAEVVLFEGVTPGAVDYSAVVQKVRQVGADTVIFGGYHPEASKIVSQLKKKRVNVKFISDDGVKDDTFIKVAGADAEGVYASGPQDVSGLEMNKAARAAHVAEFGAEPGAFFDAAYAAMQALVNAIDKADSTDADKIMNVLRTETVDTAIGAIKFDARGDAEGAGFSMYQVQNGAFVELK
ncbi:amino acid/amide ABC transporter substrate-binding protein, HAAT family [Desulfomicrobium norvegicum]|uniref:Amino acid/amide ABC transporter substrate-binding protein, HAAT family n=1 Tax=Desulfomicrobium norvegicum (strain DSM 1741 / NCIMB 8310) TaxID=52561 RepID=A0A8G2FFK0_DESNO|nr:branched-chain amino acid ABC transporter substrate-binding protein [Desulfomicrobium norvegicum]SFM07508.1 amino acid/amide ABC transporter substrate-binding protein, HAAT family [Desulfomicrobium norvegicum]